MFDVDKNGVVTITAGDSGRSTLFVNSGTDYAPIRYRLKEGDSCKLTVTEINAPKNAAPLIEKVFTLADLNDDGDIKIFFAPTDTDSLRPATYSYKVKLFTSEGDVNTIVDKTNFIVIE